MIDSINQMCQTWGAQKLYMMRASLVSVTATVPSAISALELTDRQAALEQFRLGQIRKQKAARSFHEQGWTPQSVLAKFREMRDGAGSSTQREVLQFTEEGHTGEGLLVARALSDAPEVLRGVTFVHYVIPDVRSKIKAQTLNISVPEYWRHIDRAHYWIAARMTLDRSYSSQVVETTCHLSQQ